MEEQETIVIDVQLQESDIANRLAEINQKMVEITNESRSMKQAIKEATEGIQENEMALADNNSRLSELKESQATATQAYSALGEQIQTLTEEYSALEASTTQDLDSMAALAEQIDLLTQKQADYSNEMQQYATEIKAIEQENNQLSASTESYKETIAGATYVLAENVAETRALKSEQQTLEGQIRSIGEADREYADSLKGMQAELAALRDQYASLSAAERESASGQALLQHMAELDEQVKETKASMGQFQDNVGNYPQVVTSIIPGFDKLNKVLNTMGTSMEKLASKGKISFKGLTTAVKTFGKAFVSWPIIVIVAVLSAIMLVVNAVRDALKRNDQMLTQVQKSLAVLEPILKIVGKAFDIVGQAVAFLIEKLVSAVEWVGRFLTSIGLLPAAVMETVDAKKALVQAIDDLEDTERKYTVNSAKREMEIAEKRAELADKDNHTFEERKKLLAEVQELEKQDLEEKKAIAEEHLRILQEQQRLNRDYSDEMADNIAEAQAKVYEATKEFQEGLRKINSETTQLNREEQKSLEDAQRKAREAYKKHLQKIAQQKRELSEIDKQINKYTLEEIKRSNQEYMRGLNADIQAKKQQLKTDKKMTLEQRKELENEILQMELDTSIKEKELAYQVYVTEQRFALETFKAEKEAKIQQLKEQGVLTKEIEAGIRNEILQEEQKMSDEQYQMAEDTQLEIAQMRFETLQKMGENELELEKKNWEKREKEEQRRTDKKLRDAEGNELEQTRIQIEASQNRLNKLLSMDEEAQIATFGSHERWVQEVENEKERLHKLSVQEIKDIWNQASAYAQAAASITSGISGVFDAIMQGMDEDSEEYAAMARQMALMTWGEIGMKSAAGVASAVAAGAGLAWPANLAAIASGVTAVLAGIASAIQTYNQYKEYFAEGGIVGGNKFFGDKIHAQLNSGEMVLNDEQQANLFRLINQPRLNEGTNFDQMVEAFGVALAEQPNPILDYSEFTTFTNGVNERTNKTIIK